MFRKLAVFLVIAGIGLVISAPGVRGQPVEDRVGFPEGYRERYAKAYTFDRPDNNTVRVIYANRPIGDLQQGQPFPYGTILVMENYRAQLDDAGEPVLDRNSRFVPGELTGIFVMRKEPGFGVDYGEFQTGEWEYVAFRPDGSYLNAPSETVACARCHLDIGPRVDRTARMSLAFTRASGALPHSVMQSYLFLPSEIRVKAGSTVTWYNDDVIPHTVTAPDGAFDSGRMLWGASFSRAFAQTGAYEFFCSLHPRIMRGTVVVEA